MRQGCVLSPLLFNIYGEWIIRRATEDWNGRVFIEGRKILNLRYADDTTLLASSEQEMLELLRCIENVSLEAGLRLNRSKCCLMVVAKATVFPQHLHLIQRIGKKDDIIYLGARITNKGRSKPEVKRRIGMARNTIAKLVKIWKDHSIRKKTKRRLVQALNFPIATYRSETLDSECFLSPKNRGIRDAMLSEKC